MRTKRLALLAVAAMSTLGLASCGNDKPSSTGGGNTATGKVGVILPDASTSPRWEANDRPLLKSAFDAASIGSDIQNANGDKAKFATICENMINEGVQVLLIVNLDSETGAACLKKAQTAGIKTTANIVYINGDPTDNNAALFKQGYSEALKPLIDGGKYKLVGDQTGKWDATVAGTAFEQLYTQNGGKIDGIISANDTMAGGIIARLKANGLNGKVPITGQDASKEGLQAILAGDQCMTVYKAIKKEADAAAKLSIALIKGEDASSIASGSVKDTVLNTDVKSALQTPQAIFKDTVKDVIADGFWKKGDICTGQYASACQAAGIS